MQSREVRRAFLDYFAAKGHQIVPSSPLILPQDPTLLFANAGMNQFKEVFRGRESRPYARAVSSQKCLRVSGKHNDLEEVGRTPRHHTFFEMLGNFSFGDYFKREAIAWAWELVHDRYKLPAERLYVTVFEGDDQVPGDEEAARLWTEVAGVPAARVVALGRKDNFWQMGDVGPAGPCSEIHVDMRPDQPPATPKTEPERYLEIWNLVFMQYDLQPGGGLGKLPAPCVDTGAGLERMTAVLGGFASNYDTDLFQPIIQALAGAAGVRYGDDPSGRDVSLRVISDHLRALTMLTAEGVIPGPEKRGAVLRRIMRRALRHGHMLGLPSPFLYEQIPVVVATLGETFPELRTAQELVQKITRREEERFKRTLNDGLARLEERIGTLAGSGHTVFPGDEAFVLESEQGMPLDLLRDALEERRMVLDETGYAAARQQHIQASRVLKGPKQEAIGLEVLAPLRDHGSQFVGREVLRVEAARVIGLMQAGRAVTRATVGERVDVVLDVTPFYAESGGQIGDQGQLIGGSAHLRVVETQSPLPGVILHQAEVDQGAIAVGDVVVAAVDADRRDGAMLHHTATHLLHAALRRQLGPHVRQAGSLVAVDRLRFDFAHFEAIPKDQAVEIEAEVNEAIQADLPVETVEMSLDDALATGAMAFFGDRYGDRVRVVRIGEVSLELCGGTHVSRTGRIGSLLLTGERGVAAGVRRIEAIGGSVALERARHDIDALQLVAERLSTQRHDLVEELERKLDVIKRLQRENEELKLKLVRQDAATSDDLIDVAGLSLVAKRVDGLGRGQRRDLADSLRQKHPGAVVVLGCNEEGKAALLIAVGAGAQSRVDARELIRRLGPVVGGGGGGRPDMAEAGGKNPDRLDEAIRQAPVALAELLQAR